MCLKLSDKVKVNFDHEDEGGRYAIAYKVVTRNYQSIYAYLHTNNILTYEIGKETVSDRQSRTITHAELDSDETISNGIYVFTELSQAIETAKTRGWSKVLAVKCYKKDFVAAGFCNTYHDIWQEIERSAVFMAVTPVEEHCVARG